MTFYQKILNFLFFCNFISTGICQKNGQFIYESTEIESPFTVTQYSSKHGLPQNQVLKMIELPNGNLVISTANGIVQFNGNQFKNFTTDKNHKNYIFYDIFYASEYNKLFGTVYGGLFFSIKPKIKKESDFSATTLYQNILFSISSDGTIYQSKVDKINFQKIATTFNINPLQILVNKNKVFITSQLGLKVFDLKTKTLQTLYNLPVIKVKIFKNKVYFTTPSSLECIDIQTKKHTTLSRSKFSDNQNLDFEIVSENEFYIGSNHGLLHHKNNKEKLYNKENNLPSSNIHSLFYSQKNNCLFVGTAQKGLLKLDFKTVYNTIKPEEIKLNSLSSIVNFENKILVSGSSGTIFDVTDRKEAKIYARSNYLLACLSVVDDCLAAGSWGAGFSLYKNGKEIKKIDDKKILKNPFVHAIYQDSKKQIWIGTGSGIAMGQNINKIKAFKELNCPVICFKELKDETICVGTSEGIYFIKHNKIIKHIGRKNGFFGKEVRSFYEDKKGRLWIGTYNGGLYCYYKNKFESINSKENCKLPLDIFCIAPGKNNMLYFTGNLGLYTVSEKKLEDFYTKKINFLIPYFYGEESGIYNTEFNGGFQNNFHNKNNTFYFPTLEGIAIFEPKAIVKAKSKLILENIYVNEKLATLKSLELGPETSSIRFEFTKANFLTNNSIYFQYKIERNGEHQPWSYLRQFNFINFRLLPHGKYKLKIRAIDSFNEQFPETLSYSFTIKPHFYQTWPFFILIAITLLSLGGLFVKIRKDRYEKKVELNNQVNNQILELKLAAIQARMNPHFIFNSLNSIKYYLLIEDKDKAENLIDDFSKLLRKFLHYSDMQFIKIHEEIDLLKLYLSIEKGRFNNTFNFHFTIEEKLQNQYIPTLIIQPFIENSIKHGFSDIREKMNISLSIESENEFIKIIIQDNGVGFNSADLNATKNQQSKGIKLVEDKIANLKDKYGIFVNLAIFSEQNKGTTVTIKLKNYYDEMLNN